MFSEVMTIATLKDIAKACGVSVSTVSRVINDDKTLKVSQALREQIQTTAQNMNYVKKHKNLQNKLHIAVVLWYDSAQEIEDPYYLEIRHGIEQQAKEESLYIMTLYKQDDTYDLDALNDIDGLIALGKFSEDDIKAFKTKTPHIVFADSSPNPLKFDSVVIDFDLAMSQLCDYLNAQQYRTIGYIGGYEPGTRLLEPREQRLKGHLMKSNQYDAKHMHHGAFTSQSGYKIMQDIITTQHPASVYVCANDSIAFGATKALLEQNIKVPEDVAIIGFNDIAQAAYIHPALTTIHINTPAMGKEALSSLLERMKHPHKVPVKKVLPTTLMKRQSG